MRESLCEGVRSMSVDGYTEGNLSHLLSSWMRIPQDRSPLVEHATDFSGFSPAVLIKKLYGEWWSAEREGKGIGRYERALSRFKQYFAQLCQRSSSSIRRPRSTASIAKTVRMRCGPLLFVLFV
ncbi:hypothetical protein LCP963914a_7095 [Penicillium roqueforti]|nr:hypothetical protein LCP963914a_7095 [Penicillium roqueforti]KAI3201841.1 hypothetical protein CBS147311_4829 [Penicillium roqueforti]